MSGLRLFVGTFVIGAAVTLSAASNPDNAPVPGEAVAQCHQPGQMFNNCARLRTSKIADLRGDAGPEEYALAGWTCIEFDNGITRCAPPGWNE